MIQGEFRKRQGEIRTRQGEFRKRKGEFGERQGEFQTRLGDHPEHHRCTADAPGLHRGSTRDANDNRIYVYIYIH